MACPVAAPALPPVIAAADQRNGQGSPETAVPVKASTSPNPSGIRSAAAAIPVSATQTAPAKLLKNDTGGTRLSRPGFATVSLNNVFI